MSVSQSVHRIQCARAITKMNANGFLQRRTNTNTRGRINIRLLTTVIEFEKGPFERKCTHINESEFLIDASVCECVVCVHALPTWKHT